MHAALEAILATGVRITPTKGAALDLTSVVLELENPRARLSRSAARGKVFSALGELLWYLSGSNRVEFIEYYINYYRERGEGGQIWGGYGPRLFAFDGFDQVGFVSRKLRENPSSRQAVIQLFDHRDLQAEHEDVPCTCTVQFLVRSDELNVITYMRSNDAYLGLPHDVFAFTFIQELVARDLGVGVGRYFHHVGSLHLYEDKIEAASAFLVEGWQSDAPMPAMPTGSQWPAVGELLGIEEGLRLGSIDPLSVDPDFDAYWADLARMLAIFRLMKDGRTDEANKMGDLVTAPIYKVYISDRLVHGE